MKRWIMENNKEFNITESADNFDLMGIDESYKTHRFRKKKHGIAGFFQKIGIGISEWWQKLKKWQKITYSTIASIVAVILVLVIVFFSYFGYNYNSITGNPDDLGFANVIDKKVVNVALFGLDTRDTKSFKGNSDSIMVLSINTETKTVKIVSIMRDSLVCIDRDGKKSYNKINSAYASGGPELAIKTINQNFGLDISEYATVNFFGMAEIIDAVGGIDAELTTQEVSTNHTDGLNGLIKRHCDKLDIDPEPYYIKTAGKHHLNGIQAVAYSRIRKFVNIWGTNNDFGRTDRQRYVMEQLFNKALTLPKSKYVKLVKALIPYTETSLSYSEIMGLAVNVLLHSPTFEQTRMPLSEYQMKAPSIPRVGSCVYYDLEFAKNLLHAFFYENITPEAYVEANGIDKNDWYAQIRGSSGSSGSSSKTSSTSSKDTGSKDTQSENSPSSNNSSTQSKPSNSSISSTTSDNSSSVDSSSVTSDSSSNSSSSQASSSEVGSSGEAGSSSELPSSSETPSSSEAASSTEPPTSTEPTPSTSSDSTSSDNTTTQ